MPKSPRVTDKSKTDDTTGISDDIKSEIKSVMQNEFFKIPRKTLYELESESMPAT